MDTSPKGSLNSSPKRGGKKGTAHERKIHEHRDTGEPKPAWDVTASHGRIGRGYFRDTYRDVISHCERLSTYDE